MNFFTKPIKLTWDYKILIICDSRELQYMFRWIPNNKFTNINAS